MMNINEQSPKKKTTVTKKNEIMTNDEIFKKLIKFFD